MIGAIIGDIIGSKYEFNNIRYKKFKLFSEDCFATDDSIMTMAIMDMYNKGYLDNKEKIIDTFKKWGNDYPGRGYGGRFLRWLVTDTRESYNSFGNGSAMRVSPIGWIANSEEEVKKYSYNVTSVTHDHIEGLKGAEVTAMCVYYARNKKSKEFIKEYVSEYYNLDFDYEDLRKNYKFTEICQDTVPQAIYCFLISDSFEDCIRTVISIGGDCDTTAAIAVAIAGAYYGIDKKIREKAYNYLDNNMKKVIETFENKVNESK